MSAAGHISVMHQGLRVSMTPDQAVSIAVEIDRSILRQNQGIVADMLKLGAFLLSVRPNYPRGAWMEWVKTTGIHSRRVGRAMQMAAKLADDAGTPDPAKFREYGLDQTEPGISATRASDIGRGVSMRQVLKAIGRGEDDADSGEVEEVEDTSQYASEAELAFYLDGDGERDDELGELVARGTAVAAPKAAAAQGVAGRIGPGELPAGRRPEAAGQLTLLSAWMELERDVERFEDPGKAERARLIVTDGLADIRRRLADLDRAA